MNPKQLNLFIQELKSTKNADMAFQITQDRMKNLQIQCFCNFVYCTETNSYKIINSSESILVGVQITDVESRISNLVLRDKKRTIIPKSKMIKIVDNDFFNCIEYDYLILQANIFEGNPYSFILLFFNPNYKPSYTEIEVVSVYLKLIIFQLIQFDRTIQLKNTNEQLSDFLYEHFPKRIADELKQNGSIEPVHYESVSILFTDFVGFTKLTEQISPTDLVNMLDGYFFYFDDIVKKYHIERLKTIGDSYMCVSGIDHDIDVKYHAIYICLAGLEILNFVKLMAEVNPDQNKETWNIRIGINSGSIIGGVVGKFRPTFDIWGSSVNIASRMESSSIPDKINISESTYELVKDYFETEYRGIIEVKNGQKFKMYFLKRIHIEYSYDTEGFLPNEKFLQMFGLI